MGMLFLLSNGEPMKLPIVFCSALSSVLFCSTTRAAEPVSCPDTISVHQELAAPVGDWKSIVDDAPIRLAGVTFYDGAPEKKISLVNDSSSKNGSKQIAVWHFQPDAKREIWIACSYSGTSVVLATPLPAATTACLVTYETRQRIAGLPAIEKISCEQKRRSDAEHRSK